MWLLSKPVWKETSAEAFVIKRLVSLATVMTDRADEGPKCTVSVHFMKSLGSVERADIGVIATSTILRCNGIDMGAIRTCIFAGKDVLCKA